MLDDWQDKSLPELRDNVNDRLDTLSQELKGMEQAYYHFVATLDQSVGEPLFPEIQGHIDFSYAGYQHKMVVLSIARALVALRHIDIMSDLKKIFMAPAAQLSSDMQETLGTAIILKNQANAYFKMLPVSEESDAEHGFNADDLKQEISLLESHLAYHLAPEDGVAAGKPLSQSKTELQDELGKNIHLYSIFTLQAMQEHLDVTKALYNILSTDPAAVPDTLKEGYPHPEYFFSETVFMARNQLMAIPSFVERAAQAIRTEQNLRGREKIVSSTRVAPEMSRALPLFPLDHFSL